MMTKILTENRKSTGRQKGPPKEHLGNEVRIGKKTTEKSNRKNFTIKIFNFEKTSFFLVTKISADRLHVHSITHIFN